jgi:hypothetical protein
MTDPTGTDGEWRFDDLRALYVNCTLKRSPERSHPRGWPGGRLPAHRQRGRGQAFRHEILYSLQHLGRCSSGPAASRPTATSARSGRPAAASTPTAPNTADRGHGWLGDSTVLIERMGSSCARPTGKQLEPPWRPNWPTRRRRQPLTGWPGPGGGCPTSTVRSRPGSAPWPPTVELTWMNLPRMWPSSSPASTPKAWGTMRWRTAGWPGPRTCWAVSPTRSNGGG